MFLLIFLLAGCNTTSDVSVRRLDENKLQVDEIENILESDNSIEKANMIVLDDEIFIAVQMKPWLKLKKSKQEKKILKKLKKVKSVEKITVSNDFKLYWESKKLMKKDVTEKEAKKEIAHLKKLKKEET